MDSGHGEKKCAVVHRGNQMFGGCGVLVLQSPTATLVPLPLVHQKAPRFSDYRTRENRSSLKTPRKTRPGVRMELSPDVFMIKSRRLQRLQRNQM